MKRLVEIDAAAQTKAGGKLLRTFRPQHLRSHVGWIGDDAIDRLNRVVRTGLAGRSASGK